MFESCRYCGFSMQPEESKCSVCGRERAQETVADEMREKLTIEAEQIPPVAEDIQQNGNLQNEDKGENVQGAEPVPEAPGISGQAGPVPYFYGQQPPPPGYYNMPVQPPYPPVQYGAGPNGAPPYNWPPYQPYPAPPPFYTPPKPKKKTWLVIVAVVCAFLVLLASVLGVLYWADKTAFGVPNAAEQPLPDGVERMNLNLDSPTPFYPVFYRLGERYYLMSAPGMRPVELSGSFSSSTYLNKDGSMIWYTQASQKENSRPDLYCANAAGSFYLAETNVSDVMIASDGKFAFYEKSGGATGLCRYDSSLRESTEIATRVYDYAVSPNGEYVLCGDDETLFLINAGSGEKTDIAAGDYLQPVFVSDDGQTMAYMEKEDGVTNFVLLPGVEKERKLRVENYPEFWLNRSADAFLLYTDGDVYRYGDGKWEQLEAKTEEYTFYPVHNGILQKKVSTAHNSTAVIDVEDFSSLFYFIKGSVHAEEADSRGLFYAASDGTVKQIETDAYRPAAISPDGKTLYFKNDSKLLSAKINQDENIEITVVVEKNTGAFALAPDGKTLYYIQTEWMGKEGTQYRLYCRLEDGRVEKVTDNTREFWTGGSDGRSCTYIEGGDTYGGKAGTGGFYSPGGDSFTIEEKVYSILPPDAADTFFYTTSPTKKMLGSSYKSNLHYYNGTEGILIQKNVERLNGYIEPIQWYYYLTDWNG